MLCWQIYMQFPLRNIFWLELFEETYFSYCYDLSSVTFGCFAEWRIHWNSLQLTLWAIVVTSPSNQGWILMIKWIYIPVLSQYHTDVVAMALSEDTSLPYKDGIFYLSLIQILNCFSRLASVKWHLLSVEPVSRYINHK